MTFAASHQAPPTGLPTWDQPDGTRPNGPTLSAGLDVQVVQWWGDWAHIECSNGWKAWVDGRALRPIAVQAAYTAQAAYTPQAAYAPQANAAPVAMAGTPYQPVNTAPPMPIATPARPMAARGQFKPSLPLAGAAVALISAFLPWYSYKGTSLTSMKSPVQYLFDNSTTARGGLKIGALVVLVSLVAGGLAVRPLSKVVRRACGSALIGVAMLYLNQTRSLLSQGHISVFSALGFGVYLCIIGGALVSFGKVPGEPK